MKPSRITESDLDAAQANVRLAQALAAAGWNFQQVNLHGSVLLKVTELVVPSGTTPALINDEYQYDMSIYRNGLFTKMPNLRKVIIEPGARIPSYYFACLKADKVQVPVDIAMTYPGGKANCIFRDAQLRRVLVTRPSGNHHPEDLAKDGPYVFFNASMESIRFEEGVPCVPRSFCYKCKDLASVELPRSCRYIGSEAFAQCTGLESIRVPDGCEIMHNTFGQCTSLQRVEGRMGAVGTYAFAYSGLRSVELDMREIPYNVFQNCDQLESVKFGPNVTRIGSEAFLECVRLRSVNLPPGVAIVAADVFRRCTAMTSISIGNPQLNAVRSAGEQPFKNCSGIRTAVFGFPVGRPGTEYRILQNLGLTENQAHKVMVAAPDRNPEYAQLLQGLAEAGFAPTLYRGTLLVAFDGAEGMTPEDAGVLTEVIQACSGNFSIVFADENKRAVQRLQDLSQIKTVLFVRTAG